MDNKEIQNQRIKNYFIESAKNMLRTEGLKSLSVRTVSQNAGYSYATLYNYFKNLQDLFNYCINDFYEECFQYVNNEKYDCSNQIDFIVSKTKMYMKFYIQYPGIFDLIFTEKLTETNNNQAIYKANNDLLNNLLDSHYNALINEIDKQFIDTFKELNHGYVHGILVQYMTRRTDINYSDFMNNYERIARKLFELSISKK